VFAVPELQPQRGPDRHCLLVDQGNSRIKWIGAVWSAMSSHWDLDVTTFGEGDVEALERVLDSGDMLPPEEVLLSSVASEDRAAEVELAVAAHSAARVVPLRSEAETCGIRNGYRDPAQLGVDRWMAVLGAARHHGLPLVVMDLGSATTLDAVDGRGRHLGGLILPGPDAMLGALKSGTDLDLSNATVDSRRKCAAGEAQRETLRAIEGGIVTAQLGALEQFVEWFRKRLGNGSGGELKIVVTGGAAGAILRQSDYQLTHDPLLLFKGMLLSRFGPGEPQH
jgi:type III pantothenate kinase